MATSTFNPADYGLTPVKPGEFTPVARDFPDKTPPPAAAPADADRHPLLAGLKHAETGLTVGLPYEARKLTGHLTPEQEQEALAKIAASKAEEDKLLPGGPTSLGDIHDLGDVLKFGKEQLLYGAPQIAPAVVGGIGGSILGAEGGPLTAAGGGIAGAAMGLGLGLPGATGSAVTEDTEGGTKPLTDVEAERAPAVGLGTATINVLPTRFIPGLSRVPTLLAPLAKGIIGKTALHTVEAGAQGALMGGAQSELTRYGQDKDLLSPEAGQEAGSSAASMGVLGAMAGAVTGPFAKGKPKVAPPVTEKTKVDPVAPTGQSADLLQPGPTTAVDDRVGAANPPDVIYQGGPAHPPLAITDQRPGARPSEVYGPAIASIESAGSGDYKALGPVLKTGSYAGDRAHGRYGIMGNNIAQWSREALGRVVTREEFDNNPAIQDRIFDHQFGKLIERYGSPEEAARHWLGTGAHDALGTTPDAYVKKFQTAMGGASGAAGEPGAAAPGVDTGVEGAIARNPLLTQLMAHLTDASGVPEGTAPPHPVTKLAASIAAGGDHAADALGQERQAIVRDHDALLRNEDQLTRPQQEEQLARLAQREKILTAAQDAAEKLARDRGPTLVTEPQPGLVHADTLPGGPQPQTPEGVALTDRLRLQEAHDAANERSAKAMMEAGHVATGQSAFEKAARGKILGRMIGDKTELNPREAFQQHITKAGYHPEISDSEHALLQDEEFHRQREATNAAREQANAEAEALAKQQPQGQEHLGVPGQEEVAARRAPAPREEAPAPEPVAEAPAPTPEQEITENIRTRGETHIQNRELGPVKAKWFREGMKQAFGEEHTPPTTVKTTQENFKAGQDFVAEERAHQAREHATAAEQERMAREASTPPERPAPLPKRTQALRKERVRQPSEPLARQVIRARLGEAPEAAREAAAKSKEKAEVKAEPKKAPPPAAEKAKEASKAKEPALAEKAKPAPKVEKPAAEKAKAASKEKAAPKPKPTTEVEAKAKAIVEERTETATKEQAAAEADAKTRADFTDSLDDKVGKDLSAFQKQRLDQLANTKIGDQHIVDADVLAKALKVEEERYAKGGHDAQIGQGETFKDFVTRVQQALRESEKSGLKAQEITRRDVMKGTGGVAGVLGALKAIPAEARTKVDDNGRVKAAIKKGSLHETVQAIADTTKNPAYRTLARSMLLGGFAKDARIEAWDLGEGKLNVTGITDPSSGNVKVFHTSEGATGLSEETILHEALHSWLAARYKDLETFPANRDLLGLKGTQKAEPFIKDFLALHKQFKAMMGKKFPEMIDSDGKDVQWWAHFSAADPDEFFVRSLTEPDLQKFLREHSMTGEKIAPNAPTSMWARFVQMVRNLFGIKPPASALDDVMRAGWGVLKSGTLDEMRPLNKRGVAEWENAGRSEGGRKMFATGADEAASVQETTDQLKKSAVGPGQKIKAEAEPKTKEEVEKAVTGDPPPLPKNGQFSLDPAAKDVPPRMKTEDAVERRSALDTSIAAINQSGADLLKKGGLFLSETEDIVNMGKKYMPSLVDLNEAHSRGLALGRDLKKRVAAIDDRIRNLPAEFQGVKPGSISDFLYDSTTQKKWGFDPTWVKANEIDPAMVKRFDAIAAKSPEAAQIIKDMFEFNHDARTAMGDATLGAIDAEYDPAIAEATTDAERTALETQKADAIKHHSRVFDTQEGLPYTPTKRQGAWAVVGQSKELLAAKKAGDTETLAKLRKDQDHYYVDMRDTAAGAEVLAGHLREKFGKDGTSLFERGQGDNQGISPKEMLLAFKRFQGSMDTTGMGMKASARITQMARDFYLHSLSEDNARKGELRRENVPARDPVTGEVLDMVQSFLSRGQATADYTASIANNGAIQKALNGMNKEVSGIVGPDRTTAQRIHNEVMWRYEANLGAKSNRAVDNVLKATSLSMLLTQPFYYIQNATQVAAISHPAMAKQFGWARSAGHLAKAYGDWFGMTKNIGLLDRLHYDDAPADVRDVLHQLADRGRLDAGITIENRPWYMNGDGLLPKAWNKFDQFLRMAPQRIEVMNRVVTGIATYRAALEKGLSEGEAFNAASELIRTTHGDYSGFNSPRVFSQFGQAGRLAGQFRKFQVIMAANVVRDFNAMFRGATLEEKLVGMKGLAFLSAHMAAVGGIVGLPGTALFGPLVAQLMNITNPGQHKEWSDWQNTLREGLGAGKGGDKANLLADLLYKGAPYALMKFDTSDRLGMGNMLALAPYSGLDEAGFDKDKWYSVVGQMMLGPAGKMVAKGLSGLDYGVNHDDWTRMAESVAPGVLGSTAKAYRLKAHGLVNKAGVQLLKPEDISYYDAALTAIGVNPSHLVDQAEKTSDLYNVGQFYDAKTAKLKVDFIKAREANDAARTQDIRAKWRDMQMAQRGQGLKPSPMSTLYKAPRELAKKQHQVMGGVAYDKSDRRFVMQMMLDRADMEEQARKAAES
jgi:hypothetical protein